MHICGQSRARMSIFRTMRSASGRTRSIDKQAVGKVGAQNFESIGEKKGPLELPRGDAAMQELALLSSPCRPRITSWFSSSVISSWSRVNPATARVIRSRSGSFSQRGCVRCCRADSPPRRPWPPGRAPARPRRSQAGTVTTKTVRATLQVLSREALSRRFVWGPLMQHPRSLAATGGIWRSGSPRSRPARLMSPAQAEPGAWRCCESLSKRPRFAKVLGHAGPMDATGRK